MPFASMDFEQRRCQVFLATVLWAAIHLTLAMSNEIFMKNEMDAVPSFLIIGTAKGGTVCKIVTAHAH